MLPAILGIVPAVLNLIAANSKTGGAIRHGLTAGGGLAVGIGLGDAAAPTEVYMQIEAIIGGIMAALGLYASVRAKLARK